MGRRPGLSIHLRVLGVPACSQQEEQMRHMRSAALFALGIALMIVGAGTAVAVAPGNDTYAGRTVVGALPFTEVLDTTEATTDGDDAELTAQCSVQATDASVWYEVTAPVDGGLQIRTFFSSYPASAIVATGGPGNWTVVACSADVIDLPAPAGTTYTILVVDEQLDEGGNGGTLNFSIDVVDLTVNRFATFNPRTGSATVSGTLLCAGEWGGVDTLSATLTQRAGRFTVRGFAFIEPGVLVCDNMHRSWSAEVVPDSGKFAGGQAAITVSAHICEEFGCGTDALETIVVLRAGGR